MKAKTFEKFIRKIIREEIDYALRRELKSLKEDLRDDFKPIINENVEPINIEQPLLKEKIMGKKPFKKHTFVQGNSTLNDLLNQTAQGDTNLNRGSSPAIIEEDFNPIVGMPAEAAPKAVQEAVNRDYSALMKAIDKKKNNRP